MSGIELWTLAVSSPTIAVRQAERAEAAGWHGIGVTDSQNLAGDPWVALTAMAAASPPASAQQEVKRSITEIAPNLYRFQNNFHVSVFLVTADGVIATDPINAAAATWLEGEIKTRFNQEI